MADETLYDTLLAEGLISNESFEKIKQKDANPLFSIHWEIKTLLYVGILLLTTGLGLLVYENIDSIGHVFVLLFIALISVGCFVYCFKYKLPFSTSKVNSPNTAFNYILLLAATSFVIFAGYLQYQYKVFGTHYGMATFVPMLVLFFIAYYFDQLGVLNMAIASLAVWMGVTVTPSDLLEKYDFNSTAIIYTYLGLGLVLIVKAIATNYFNFKKHFKFSYQHYGVHALYISLLAGYFHFYDFLYALLWLLGIGIVSFFLYKDAIKHHSFYFLLLMILYSYVAISSLVIRMLSPGYNTGAVGLIFMYFIISALGLVLLLIHFNKKLKQHDQL
ncbi:MAG TPA: DUF2157 domain-containing protein [Mucilaginibacter sp.]|nr:DUF2157 domain-containing protein [Mucilaginibacter sp.]